MVHIAKHPFAHAVFVVIAPTSENRIKVVDYPLRCGLLVGIKPFPNAFEKIFDLFLIWHHVAATVELSDREP